MHVGISFLEIEHDEREEKVIITMFVGLCHGLLTLCTYILHVCGQAIRLVQLAVVSCWLLRIR